MELRGWQKRAYKKLVAKGGKDFFLEATPGAGKTKFACHVALQKRKLSEIDRIIVVVPTTSLKEQWADDLHAVGIHAEPNYKGGGWPSDFDAICVTYQQVGSDPMILALFCRRQKTLVVLDEIHHCADEATWGKAVLCAFSDAIFRLAMSGTPFRSDASAIPFLSYIDGKAVPDELYGYGEGLRDKICRHVFFPRQGGLMEWSTPSGQLMSKTFDDELSESHANQRLRTALTTGEWIVDTIKDASKLLDSMREEDPDAGGLVIAIDQSHAKAIARKMRQHLGVEADCVLSDDPDSQDKLKSFKDSSRPWIIAVKMVSEGVNIPRLRVGIYATTTKTEMFFRQAVGRFVRVEADHDDPTASVFIPDDPRLRQFAEEIRRQRIHELEQELEDERERQERADQEDNLDCSFFMPLSSSAENKGTIVDDATFTPEQIEEAEKIAAGACSPQIAALLLMRSGYFKPTESSKPKAEPRRADIKARLRNTCNNLVRSIAFNTGEEYSHVNQMLNVQVGIRSVKEATIAQLEARIKAAEKMAAKYAEGHRAKS